MHVEIDTLANGGWNFVRGDTQICTHLLSADVGQVQEDANMLIDCQECMQPIGIDSIEQFIKERGG